MKKKKKTYKQRVLDAQKDLMRRYLENDPPEACPFCEIYPASQYRECFGCFMADSLGNPGCMRFASSLDSTIMHVADESRRLKRHEFHKLARRLLIECDPRLFTPSGWKFFEIPEWW